jgi:hypothetical protein
MLARIQPWVISGFTGGSTAVAPAWKGSETGWCPRSPGWCSALHRSIVPAASLLRRGWGRIVNGRQLYCEAT